MDLWITLVGSALVTVFTRTFPLVVRAPLPETSRARRYLDALPVSIIAALAGAAVLGISIGLSGLGTRIATDLDLVRVAADDANNVFDLDMGFRP